MTDKPTCPTCRSDDPDPEMNIRAEVDIGVGVQVAKWCPDAFHDQPAQEPAPPDANCITTPDGGCESTESCMHTTPPDLVKAAHEAIERLWRCDTGEPFNAAHAALDAAVEDAYSRGVEHGTAVYLRRHATGGPQAMTENEKPAQSEVERRNNLRFEVMAAMTGPVRNAGVLDTLIAAERADAAEKAVSGMHAAKCQCGDEWLPREPDGSPYVDPRCLAARKKAADGNV